MILGVPILKHFRLPESYTLSFRLKEDTDGLIQGKQRLQRKLENYSIFHKYMEKALERGEEFHEMRDVIARYDTLTATHEVREFIIWRIHFHKC